MTGLDARQATRRAIGDVMRARDGLPWLAIIDPLADPLGAIAAACAVAAEAAACVRDFTRMAREAGRAWGEIGEPMGFADDPRPGLTSVAEHAFQVAASDLGSGQVFTWQCPKCQKLILDYGPELPPDQSERGHARGCARYEAMVAAWDAQWDDGDG